MAAAPPQQPQAPAQTASQIQIPASAPVGGMTFTQPAQTAAASYYKIAQGQTITFGWNYTGLYVTPTSLTFSAYCSDNFNTYPVGPTNGVIPGNQMSITWDPWSYQQANSATPLAIGSYTLSVWDDRGPTAGPLPGYFSANEDLRFALYTPAAYTPLASGWTCAGCNSAGPNAVAGGVPIALISTCLVLLLSGWGILRMAFGAGGRRDV